MSAQLAFALPPPAASNNIVINARCSLRIEVEQRVIVVTGLPVHHYCADDAAAEAYAMVFLVESGFAQQTDVAGTPALFSTERRHPALRIAPLVSSHGAHRSAKSSRHIGLLSEA